MICIKFWKSFLEKQQKIEWKSFKNIAKIIGNRGNLFTISLNMVLLPGFGNLWKSFCLFGSLISKYQFYCKIIKNIQDCHDFQLKIRKSKEIWAEFPRWNSFSFSKMISIRIFESFYIPERYRFPRISIENCY